MTPSPPLVQLQELLSKDDFEFVEGAYALVLGRAPDPGGRGEYLEKLRSGYSKVAVLRDLARSPEWVERASRAPDIESLVRRLGIATPMARSLPELLGLNDRCFVDAAYLVVLGRPADPGGLLAYVSRIREGDSKWSILEQLRSCSEAIAFRRRLAEWMRLGSGGPLPEAAAPNGTIQDCAAQDLHSLMSLPAPAFRAHVVQIVTGREIRGDEALRWGRYPDSPEARIQWMSEVRDLPDAANLRQLRDQLDRRLALFCRSRWPLVGWWWRWRHGIEGNGENLRRMRRLESQLSLLAGATAGWAILEDDRERPEREEIAELAEAADRPSPAGSGQAHEGPSAAMLLCTLPIIESGVNPNE